jgi:hypothetical protein
MVQIYPKIKSVIPQKDRHLLVVFENGVHKRYNCNPLLNSPIFAPLREEWLFRIVQTDRGGYGIFWNDEIDLSESELWERGETIE